MLTKTLIVNYIRAIWFGFIIEIMQISIPKFWHFSISKNNFLVIVLSIFVISFSLTLLYSPNDVFGKTNNINNNKNDGNQDKFKLNVGINLINIKRKTLKYSS